MLLEYLLGLPIGARVFGDFGVAMNVAGVIESLEDGSHFGRWFRNRCAWSGARR